MTTDEQLLKLPKHARETIERLRRELAASERYAKELEVELAPPAGTSSRVLYEPKLGESGTRPLPDRAYLHFGLEGGDVRAMLQRDHEGRWFLDLNADGSLVVRPTSTNAVRIYSESRFNTRRIR